jgi:transcriptional regulator with XRE-family HTH domain
MLLTIGELCRAARDKAGLTRLAAARMMGIDERTVRNLENQCKSYPTKSTRRAVEALYGWVPGSLGHLWDQRGRLAFGEVHDGMLPRTPFAKAGALIGDPEEDGQAPLAKAQDLTTKELLAELSFRVLMMENEQQHPGRDR